MRSLPSLSASADRPVEPCQVGQDRSQRITGKRRRKRITAADLGIRLASGGEAEKFKWFLACLFFGRPIQQTVARRTYEEFAREGLVSPEAILGAGWDRLVTVLDRGHYVRYDFSTATKLLEICRGLRERYGRITELLGASASERGIVRRLQGFKGIGPVTARIFLRGLREAGTKIRRFTTTAPAAHPVRRRDPARVPPQVSTRRRAAESSQRTSPGRPTAASRPGTITPRPGR